MMMPFDQLKSLPEQKIFEARSNLWNTRTGRHGNEQ